MVRDTYRTPYGDPAPDRSGAPNMRTRFSAFARHGSVDSQATYKVLCVCLILGAVVRLVPYGLLDPFRTQFTQPSVVLLGLVTVFVFLCRDPSTPFNWHVFVVLVSWSLSYAFLLPLPLATQQGIGAGIILLFVLLFRWHYLVTASGTLVHCSRKGASPRWRPFRAMHDALVSWFTYNPNDKIRPGLISSPIGDCMTRTLLVWAAIFPLGIVAYSSQETFGLLRSLLFPSLSLFVGAFTVNFFSICRAHARKSAASLATSWDEFVATVAESSDPIERDSLYFWRNAINGAPIFIPLSILSNHMWVLGGTGAGKTWRLLALLDQFVARGYSICAIDLKGDSHEILSSLEKAASKARQRLGVRYPLKYLTNRTGDASHLFDVFNQAFWPLLPPTQKADFLLNGLAAAFSRAFGEAYFTDICFHLLNHVLERHPDVSSWHDLKSKIAYEIRHAPPHELSLKMRENADHIRVIVHRIASVDFLNESVHTPGPVRSAQVQMGEMFQQPSILYASFSSLIANITSPEIARLVMAAALTAATTVKPRQNKLVLVLDEWPSMIAGNFASLLRMARSLDIPVIILNQAAQDTVLHSINLKHVAESNTSVRAWFKVTDTIGIQQVQQLGGKAVGWSRSLSITDRGEQRSIAETVIDRFTASELNRISADHHLGLLQVTDSGGYCDYDGEPFPIRTEFHLTETDYKSLCQSAWPARSAETISVNAQTPTSTTATKQKFLLRSSMCSVDGSVTQGTTP